MLAQTKKQDSFLTTKTFGKQIHYFERIESTNDTALQLAENGAPEGSLIIADSQSAGRGQGNHNWHSPGKVGLYFSVILRPELNSVSFCPFTVCAGIAAAQALTDITGYEVQVKWPNDLILKNKKLGGILLESGAKQKSLKHLIVGIGININQTVQDFPIELRETATSLNIVTGKTFDRLEILSQILAKLEEAYYLFINQGIEPFIALFEKIDYLLDKKITVNTPRGILGGKAAGIDQTGALLIQPPGKNKLTKIISGSILSIRSNKIAACN